MIYKITTQTEQTRNNKNFINILDFINLIDRLFLITIFLDNVQKLIYVCNIWTIDSSKRIIRFIDITVVTFLFSPLSNLDVFYLFDNYVLYILKYDHECIF